MEINMKYTYMLLFMFLSFDITFCQKEVEENIIPENIVISDQKDNIVATYECDLSEKDIYLKSL